MLVGFEAVRHLAAAVLLLVSSVAPVVDLVTLPAGCLPPGAPFAGPFCLATPPPSALQILDADGGYPPPAYAAPDGARPATGAPGTGLLGPFAAGAELPPTDFAAQDPASKPTGSGTAPPSVVTPFVIAPPAVSSPSPIANPPDEESGERAPSAPPAQPGGSPLLGTDSSTSAATTLGWGLPSRVEGFDTALGPEWNLYDGPGHAGNGRRSPGAVSLADGILTITGDSAGTTEGMAWLPGAKYGRWEGRVQAPASDPSYNALLLLWPDAENFPVGGEIDFMEMVDHTRQRTNLFLHHSAANAQVGGEVRIDATQWHNWAVEWTPDHVAAFIDGVEWWRTTDPSILPPGPMHLCVQLDWFPKGGAVAQSQMHIDWVKYYPLDGSGAVTDDGASTSGVRIGAVSEGGPDAPDTQPSTASTPSPTPSLTPTPSPTPSVTPTPSPTATSTPTPTPTPTLSPTAASDTIEKNGDGSG